MDLARAGRANLDSPTDTSGADRYTVHVVADLEAMAGAAGRAELLDGSPISLETLRRLSCDSALVRHVLKGRSEPLDLGRRTSVWSAAQRRAIIVRDAGHCRFPGCELRTCDIHHLEHYGDGGRTEVGNGILACPRHHTLLHEGGFRTIGDANDLMFLRPDGTPLEP